MTTFGGYEALREVARGGAESVWPPRAVGTDAAPAFAVKALTPPPGVWDEDRLKAEVDRFLARARLQQRAAGAGEHWAPVHATGSDASGAYAVTDLYNASAQRLIAGQVKLDGPALYVIVHAVTRGLRELKDSAHRAHGALTPANVLISGRTLAKAKVVLADPAFEPKQASPEEAEAADLEAVGRLIHELVTHRPFSPGDGWPIAPSPAWSRLGGQGKRWRELCGKLLTPEPSERLRHLEELEQAIPKLYARPPRPALRAAVTLCILLFGAASAGFVYVQRDRANNQFAQTAWSRLVFDYNDWFKDFYTHLDSARRKRYAQDPDLKLIVDFVTEAERDGIDFDPAEIARAEGAGAQRDALAAHPTERATSTAGVKKTKQAQALMDLVRLVLTRHATDEDGRPVSHWRVLDLLDQRAGLYRSDERGWGRPAAYLDKLVAGVQPRRLAYRPAAGAAGGTATSRPADADEPQDLAAGIDDVIAVKPQTDAIESAWPAVRDAKGPVSRAESPLLQKFGGFVDANTHSHYEAADVDEVAPPSRQDLVKLEKAFGQLGGLSAELLKYAVTDKDKIAWDQMISDPPVSLPASDSPSFLLYEQWAAKVREYYKLSAEQNLAAKFGDFLEAERKEIEQQLAESAERGDDEAPALRQQFADLGRKANDLQSLRPILKDLPAMQKLDAELREGIPQVRQKLEDLRLAWQKKVDDYLGELAKLPIEADPILQGEWQKQRERLLASAAPDESLYRSRLKFQQFQARAKRVADDLRGLEKDLKPADVPDPAPRAWDKAVASAALDEPRSAQLRSAVTKLEELFPNAVADLQDARFRIAWARLVGDYEARRGVTVELIAAFNTIESLLDGLYLNDGETAPGSPVSVSGLYDGWAKRAGEFGNEQVKVFAALAPAADRVNRLREARSLPEGRRGDLVRLAEGAAGEKPEVALAAWRRLGELPWPGVPASLDDEQQAQHRLAELFKPLADAAHRAALTKEAAGGMAKRWAACMNAVTDVSPANVRAILARKGDFGGSEADLNGFARYNVLLDGLSAAAATNPDEEHLRPAVVEFLRAVRDPARNIPTTNAGVAAMLASLDRGLLPKKNVAPPEQMAFGSAVWKWKAVRKDDAEETAVALTFTQPAAAGQAAASTPVALQFLRVEPADPSVPPFYVCTTEASLHVFRDVLAVNHRLAGLIAANHFGSADKADSFLDTSFWRGPQAWKRVGDSLAFNDTWLAPNPGVATNDQQHPREVKVEPPTLESPMQKVRLEDALLCAKLAGARLPTAKEWAEAGRLPSDGRANLRGRPFRLQQQFIAALKAKAPAAGNVQIDWPDTGIFVPGSDVRAALRVGEVPREDAATVWNAARAGKSPGADQDYAATALWPQDVLDAGGKYPSDGKMHDLVGNVAEFVCEDAEAFEKTPTEGLDGFIAAANGRGAFGVIGGSALSPPELPVDVRLPVKGTKMGYADVGFRLAFTAPDESLVHLVRRKTRTPVFLAAGEVGR